MYLLQGLPFEYDVVVANLNSHRFPLEIEDVIALFLVKKYGCNQFIMLCINNLLLMLSTDNLQIKKDKVIAISQIVEEVFEEGVMVVAMALGINVPTVNYVSHLATR